jgi:hypothetical protein
MPAAEPRQNSPALRRLGFDNAAVGLTALI